ncbi:MAG TPA: reverse transcriptase-like protein [Solirubrobacteraceae bacterium]|nr:reverse transcriptase-like protein [Solirubrobacteraceae bacterium]
MTKGVRRTGKTRTDAERRRLSRASRDARSSPPPGPPAGWAVAWCDGGSRGNPGPAAYAYLIDTAEGVELARAAVAIGVAGAAAAEHRGVLAALERALELGVGRLEVRSDSRLVIERMRGESAPAGVGLGELVRRSRDAAERIGTVRFRWVPRDHNRAADALVDERLHEPAAQG